MPKQGWIAFIDALVVVALVLPEGRPTMDKARVESLRVTLESLIEKLVPSAAYATKIVRQGGKLISAVLEDLDPSAMWVNRTGRLSQLAIHPVDFATGDSVDFIE